MANLPVKLFPGMKIGQLCLIKLSSPADPSRARTSGEGSGLGLSIVDAVMKAHGGYVSVQSKLGDGATFKLHFLNKD